jgi:tetratricopeptide (TPR) repeat protein
LTTRRELLLAVAAVPGLALAGCAAFVPAQTAALRAHMPAGLPPRSELADTAFFAQTEFNCGPAALASALAAIGIDAKPDTLAPQIFLPARHGTLQAEMLAGARRHGALAVLLPADLEMVLREVAAGLPVVVLQNLGLSFSPLWHYAVVVGYDLDGGDIVLRSGATRRALMTLRTFEHTWARSGRWAFVAVPPGRLPRTASEAAVTQALVAFERVASPGQALRGYEAAAERWPNSLSLAIGRGNALHASGAKQAAMQAFEAAARQHRSAAAWINFGSVALELGQHDRAEAATREALAIGGAWTSEAQALRERVKLTRFSDTQSF